ncbi:methylglyoxal reductase (NADPH-dependent) gre2 [Cadophora gregata]|uniref:methylglyoxal reductase (NADPH-dependent) gre2 n=1 Tax=Cadophora gregata TaxID=51156 RepID=UPI0026DC26B0|nr:methylglyoxal reductase (NADPH-dependent) gre2 [Cadophora gregata]KAK0107021.1 methylglyoxal reductase (NADPH-dependent) gre2 [Cadophora gregata]KAK0116712.1 methylglyoxal reductase (NADPH-dependent) gre2 [Cadophora gregata f. sp. sojae]
MSEKSPPKLLVQNTALPHISITSSYSFKQFLHNFCIVFIFSRNIILHQLCNLITLSIMPSSHTQQGPKTGTGKTVLITGGSGYVAAHVLNSFLSRGYHVRTTVRSQSSAEKIKQSHKKYIDQLSFAIVEDVATPGAHDEAVKGVDGVIHTASPFQMTVTSNKTDLLDPAINGTLSLLTSIQAHNPHIKRVLITSSFAAILDLSLGTRPGYTYTESDWNPISYTEAADQKTPGPVAYCASKTFAERAAFDFVKEKKPNFEITSVCPPMVYGPAAHTVSSLSNLNTSSADIYRLMNGSTKSVPETSFYAFVDVRDLGEAHVLAYESEKAAGQRYLIASGGYTYQQVCDVIRKGFPEKRELVPEGEEGSAFPDVYGIDNGKVRRELGLEFRGLEESIGDMVREFIEIEKRVGA